MGPLGTGARRALVLVVAAGAVALGGCRQLCAEAAITWCTPGEDGGALNDPPEIGEIHVTARRPGHDEHYRGAGGAAVVEWQTTVRVFGVRHPDGDALLFVILARARRGHRPPARDRHRRAAACLRLRVDVRPGRRPGGRLRLLGGRRAGRRLHGSARFSFRLERDGSVTALGRLHARRGRKRPLPRACRKLAAARTRRTDQPQEER